MSNSIQSHSVGRSQTLSNFQVRHYCQTRSKVRVIHGSQTWPNYNCQTWLKFLVLLPIAVTFLLPHKNGSNKTSCRLLVRFRGKACCLHLRRSSRSVLGIPHKNTITTNAVKTSNHAKLHVHLRHVQLQWSTVTQNKKKNNSCGRSIDFWPL
jgi:hypothetical protein